jgi:hypothetical protein
MTMNSKDTFALLLVCLFSMPAWAQDLLPGLHTNHFQPDPEPTLRTGVTAMTSVAISLLQH